MSRADRRAAERRRKQRITEIKMRQRVEPERIAAHPQALVQEGTAWMVYMRGVPAWPFPSPTRDGAQMILDRIRREMGREGYTPSAETLEVRPVLVGPEAVPSEP